MFPWHCPGYMYASPLGFVILTFVPTLVVDTSKAGEGNGL